MREKIEDYLAMYSCSGLFSISHTILITSNSLGLIWNIIFDTIDKSEMFFFVLLLGAKVRDEIYDAFNNIYPILKSFKKQ